MSEILKVLNKKSVELKSEVVEFVGQIDISNSLSDINNGKKTLQKTANESKKVRDELLKATAAAIESSKNLDSEVNGEIKKIEQARKVLKELSVKAKELGVKPENIDRFKELTSAIKEIDILTNDLKKFDYGIRRR